MQITAELSLYPLKEEYDACIISFINVLKSSDTLAVHTHSMSTYVKGENQIVFSAIANALAEANRHTEMLSLVIKIINRPLPVEKGFFELKSKV